MVVAFQIWTSEFWWVEATAHTKNMVKGLPLSDRLEMVYEGCIFGKQHREIFPVGKSYRARTPLEIVHSDICGPMQTSSIGGCNYFLTFIDDYSRKTWVYFLKQNLMHLVVFNTLRHLWRTRMNTA